MEHIKLSSEQSYRIQILRGLAIIAVVFIHNAPGGVFQAFGRPFLNFSVGLFLFLSGFLSNSKQWNPVKRITKVLIPYVFWTFVYVASLNFGHISNMPIQFFKRLVLADSAGMMYYIFVYCQFTLLIPIVDKLGRSKYKYLGFVIAPLEIILMRYMPLFYGFTFNKYVAYIKSFSCLGWFTYFYLGYLVGNNLIEIKSSTKKMTLAWVVSIALQICEGLFQYHLGESNCGTQLKLSAILSGTIFCLIAYRYVLSNRKSDFKVLKLLGDDSFGIYFGHIAVMIFLGKIPCYSQYVVFPFDAIVAVLATFICVEIGKKILGKYSKYLAL